jgi:HEPN domain-containing protein
MKQLTQEWVTKAEGDFTSAGRELRAVEAPNFDAACFHSQQCVEKYFKACLCEANISFTKTHDLRLLLNLLLPLEPGWQQWRDSLIDMTTAAVEVRYPGFSANREIAEEMYKLCAEVRQTVRQSLGVTL